MSLAILHMIKDDLMKTKDFRKFILIWLVTILEQIFKKMEEYPKKLRNFQTLYQNTTLRKYKLKHFDIQKMREEKRDMVLSEIQSYQKELN